MNLKPHTERIEDRPTRLWPTAQVAVGADGNSTFACAAGHVAQCSSNLDSASGLGQSQSSGNAATAADYLASCFAISRHLENEYQIAISYNRRYYGVLQLCFGPSRELWTCGGGQFQFPGSRVLSLINRVLGFAQKIEIGFEMLKYNKDDSMSTERAPRKSILRSFVEDS